MIRLIVLIRGDSTAKRRKVRSYGCCGRCVNTTNGVGDANSAGQGSAEIGKLRTAFSFDVACATPLRGGIIGGRFYSPAGDCGEK